MKFVLLIFSFCLPLSVLKSQTSNKVIDTTISFKVFGVCEQCKDRIENGVKGKGVKAADWNVDTKMLTLTYEPARVTIDKLHNRIVAVGHDTYLKKANNTVYNQLPDCCHYREIESMNELNAQHLDTLFTAIQKDTSSSLTHHDIRGIVLEVDNKGSFKPLMGASISWLGTSIGAITDSLGTFTIPHTSRSERLIVSYAGYQADTLTVLPTQNVKIVLGKGKQLKEVRVTASRPSTSVKSSDPFRVSTMNTKELFKAACCNLSESFETNPSVDVSYNDAISGSKQIQLLGLSGIYTQLTVENLPGPRGLATGQGLNSIPGTWIESIQLMKGTGSVVNGFESIAGQINVELKKPETAEKLFANAYVNDQGKTDLNLNLTHKVSDRLSTVLLLHNALLTNKNIDFNNDGFRDLPTGNLFTVGNKWHYENHKGLESQFGIRYLNDHKTGGQTIFDPAKGQYIDSIYGLDINTSRVEAFGKLGYVFPGKKYQSIGLQLSAFQHKQDSYYGMNTYNGEQTNFYANLIYQSLIGNTIHKFRTGLNFVNDRYEEQFNASLFNRGERVAGGFFEYTYSPSEKFQAVAGIREDYNNMYGWFTTPRLNVRYAPLKGTIIRLSAGRGQRTANIFAENSGLFASSRHFHIMNPVEGKAYGLSPEIAWNKGISVDQHFNAFSRAAIFTLEFYRNDFVNQVVVDMEDPRMVTFYNLVGKSYSNSFQAELNMEPIRKLNLRLAYRLFDVKTSYNGELLQRPYTAKHRGFANVGYETGGWKFDYTINYNGTKRIPSTSANPFPYQRKGTSPSYVLMNAQVTKSIGKKSNFDIYLGAENLTNYFQKDAIIAADDPFGPYFDASMIWGPVTGRMFFGGVRYTLK